MDRRDNETWCIGELQIARHQCRTEVLREHHVQSVSLVALLDDVLTRRVLLFFELARDPREVFPRKAGKKSNAANRIGKIVHTGAP